jgi:hypothetical protein
MAAGDRTSGTPDGEAAGPTVGQPLVTLRRGGLQVRLHDRLAILPVESAPTPLPGAAAPWTTAATATAPAARREEPVVPERLIRRTEFWRQEEAEHYLHFWRGDVDAMRELRYALHRSTQGAYLFALDDERVLRALGTQLARGALLLTENTLPPLPPMPRVLPKAADAAAAAAAAPTAAALGLAMDPVSLPAPPLLPILEDVQIEGAEVLPEIMQSLEQVDLAIGEINTASVSLEPTPSKIPDIQAALGDASASVDATIGAL